jgi:pectate lyase
VVVVQYTFTYKQYTEQHNRDKQYIEQHNSLIRNSADSAPSLRFIPWHLPYNWGKSMENLSQGSRRMPVGKEYTEQSILVNKNKMIGFYNRDEKCLLRGTDWVFK